MADALASILGHGAAALFYVAHYHPAYTSAACVAAFILTLRYAR